MKLSSLFLSILALSMSLCHAAELPRWVQPPVWSQDVLDAFFEDAREQLVGERPQHNAVVTAAVPSTEQEHPADTSQKWSALIDAETLTAEIKRVHNQLTPALKKSASFQGGGNLVCQRDFGLLAVLFGVIDTFDAEVRWQRSAKLMKKRCLQASKNSKAVSALSFSGAKETHALLGELLRGQAPPAKRPAKARTSPNWSTKLC